MEKDDNRMIVIPVKTGIYYFIRKNNNQPENKKDKTLATDNIDKHWKERSLNTQ